MIHRVSVRYALRSLFRHPRRTILSVLGIGIGVAMALFAASWIGGAARMEINAIVESGTGHLRIVPEKWLEKHENSLRLENWQDAVRAARSLPGTDVVTTRARCNALLAFGNRTAGAEMVGVEPETEKQLNRIVQRANLEGRYLDPNDSGKVVIGRVLAEKLDVELDDELYVTLSGREGMSSAMFVIVGLLKTGTRDIDASFCHVTLETLNNTTGYEGPGEVTLLLKSNELLQECRAGLADRVPQGSAVITWKDINPSFAAGVESDRAFTKILIAIIVIVVALGIASAQLTAIMERRRELAILSALGMKGRQVISLIMLEACVVGLGGALAALLLGGTAAYQLATKGVNLATFMGEDFSFGNILFDPVVHGDFGVWLIWYSLSIAELATIAASLYPAWLAVKTDPAESLRTI
jgi:ABC-type lipoprotein release transport system permease subunit